MKNKKIVIIFVIAFIILLIVGYFAIKYVKNKTQETEVEYIPEEEITEEQFRQTIVSLYFPDKETGELVPEARLIDIREMVNIPYEKLINLLIEGPKNEKNEKIIPEGTTLLNNYLEADCITLDFSQEFLNYNKEDKEIKNKLINSIVNTLTELTEINKIKIIIAGNENEEFKEIYSRI